MEQPGLCARRAGAPGRSHQSRPRGPAPFARQPGDALGADYFKNQAVSVVYHGSAELRSDYGGIRPDQVFDWVIAHVPDTADAVLIGGGGFRAIGAIEALEAALGRPVLSANQAALWCALRVSGVDDHLNHYGQIFMMGLPES